MNVIEDSSYSFDSLQERNQQVLTFLSQLQQKEIDLYNSLDDVNLSKEQRQIIINMIKDNSQIRMNLYSTLKDLVSFHRQNVSASRTTLGQTISAIEVLENELNEAKYRMSVLDEDSQDKVRLVEINTYYGKQYNAYSKLMKTIVFICIPIILLAFLANRGVLYTNIYVLLVVIILVIGTIIIGYQIIDIFNRDDMVWDAYKWHFDKNNAPTNKDEYSDIHKNPWSDFSITCIGSECCHDGSTYDSTKNICIPNELITAS